MENRQTRRRRRSLARRQNFDMPSTVAEMHEMAETALAEARAELATMEALASAGSRRYARKAAEARKYLAAAEAKAIEDGILLPDRP